MPPFLTSKQCKEGKGRAEKDIGQAQKKQEIVSEERCPEQLGREICLQRMTGIMEKHRCFGKGHGRKPWKKGTDRYWELKKQELT